MPKRSASKSKLKLIPKRETVVTDDINMRNRENVV